MVVLIYIIQHAAWFIFNIIITIIYIFNSHRRNSKFVRLRKYRLPYREGPCLRVRHTAECCSSRPSLASHAILGEASSAWPTRVACDYMII